MSTEKYGVYASLAPTQGTTPIATGTEVVFIGAAPNVSDDSAPVDEPTLITSMSDYTTTFGGVMGDGWSLSEAAECAFNLLGLDHIWMINVNNDSSKTMGDITDSLLIGSADSLTGAYALLKMYPDHGKVANVVCAPNASKAVNTAILGIIKKMNGHWDGFLTYDLYEQASQLNASKIAQTAQIVSDKSSNGISDERALCCWPHIKTVNDNVISSAAFKACLYAKSDAERRDIPDRSIGNQFASGVQYLTLKASDSKIILSDSAATSLSADGITSFINVGGGVYNTWGDHTSLFTNGTVSDERARFDSNIRMLIKLTNDFQQKWGNVIDSPMTLSLRNDIINYEQNKLNYLVSVGALIGNPRFVFTALSNTGDTLQKGEFYFDSICTVTPPAKYIDLKLAFSSEGFSVYLEQ